MADIDSNLPVFSRGTSDPIVVSKDTSANATSNPIYTQLSDGTSAIGVTSGALDVNIASGAAGVTHVDDAAFTVATDDIVPFGAMADDTTPDSVDEGDAGVVRMGLNRILYVQPHDGTNKLDYVVINSAYGATPTALPAAGKYEATPTTYGDGDATPLLTDENGRLQIDVATIGGVPSETDDAAFSIASDLVSPMGALADDTATDSVDEGDIGLVRMSLDRRLYVQPTDSSGNDMPMMDAAARAGFQKVTDGTDTWSIDGSGFGQIDIAAQSLTAVKISKDSSANAETNPIFVQVVSGVLSGIEVLDYDTTAAVAVDATDNHDYTITGSTTIKVQCALGAASGAQKIEIIVGPLISLVSKAVQFTSMANPNWYIDFKGLLEVAQTGTTDVVRIARTNRDEGAMDVYSTLIGTEF